MKIDKIQLRKNKESLSFIIIIFLLTGGYLFFFTSTLWMPPSADASYLTPVGKEVIWDDRTITINRWQYSKEQQEMEVEIMVDNKSYDGKNKYTFSAVELRGNKLKTAVKVSDEDWIVVQIKDIPRRWSDVSLRMNVDGKNTTTLKLYTNLNDVSNVKKIESLDYVGYKNKRFSNEILIYEKEIKDNQKQQDNLRNENNEITKEIKKIQQEKVYQTDFQKQDSDSKIAEAQNDITNNEKIINDLDGDINEIRQRIEMTKKQIQDLKETQE